MSYRYEPVSIKERKAIDTLINIGLLLDKKLEKTNLTINYHDQRGGLFLTKSMDQWDYIHYVVIKTESSKQLEDINLVGLPTLFEITTTKDRINIEHYIPGAWENRLAKLAEEKLNGQDEQLPKIKKAPRLTKRTPK